MPEMQMLFVISLALLVLARADYLYPDGGACEDGQTCCQAPVDGYECCPSHQAECCEDHIHCCPEGTLCMAEESRCVNATASIPWIERVSSKPPGRSKSFRMIKSYMGEDEDNVCPDQSRCPAEFSCLRAFTRFGCCPLAQGVPCPDGKHCCPEDHQCSADSRSCVKIKEPVSAVLCQDKVSECPNETTCCETPDGSWGCCPMPKAVCCEDKLHCCPDGSTCDLQQSKCVSSSNAKDLPMWAKFPARRRAEWENQDEEAVTEEVAVSDSDEGDENSDEEEGSDDDDDDGGEEDGVDDDDDGGEEDGVDDDESVNMLAQAISDNGLPGAVAEITAANTQEEASTSPVTQAEGFDVPCDDTMACPDQNTCCRTEEESWACCPLPQAVCCEDHVHCCPHGTICDLTTMSCQSSTGMVAMVKKVPAFTTSAPASTETPLSLVTTTQAMELQTEEVPVFTTSAPASTETPLSLVTTTQAMELQTEEETVFTTSAPASTETPLSLVRTTKAMELQTEEETDGGDEEEGNFDNDIEEEGDVRCDSITSCPRHTTCCFMKAVQKWGCCPLPDAVCCSDGEHCCPANYRCDVSSTSCSKGEVVIPWYNKLPALNGVQAALNSVECDDQNRCPEDSSCCQLSTGQWGCCPLHKAVCCPDKEHCCPQGYSCHLGSSSCQKLTVMLQLQTVPLTRLYVPRLEPELSLSKEKDVHCEGRASCNDGETCCRTSAVTWGCCPSPNAVCCSGMKHCCPAGYACTPLGTCTLNARLSWDSWHMFFSNRKTPHIV